MSKKSLQLDFIELYSLLSSPKYWSPLLLTSLIMNQYPMNTFSVLIMNIQARLEIDHFTLRLRVCGRTWIGLVGFSFRVKGPGVFHCTVAGGKTSPLRVTIFNCNQFTVWLGACSSDPRVCF